jgi:hypothetical protein
MITKEEIANYWLPRYTGSPLKQFKKNILLTNFKSYVRNFSEKSDNTVDRQFAVIHLDTGIEALGELNDSGDSVNYLHFE